MIVKIKQIKKATNKDRQFFYMKPYTCYEGVHWDETTAKMYLKLMLDSTNTNL